MMLLRMHHKQLSRIHLSAVKNSSNKIEKLEEQIRDADYTFKCISMDCFKLKQMGTNPALVKNYFESSELMYMEIYSHNMLRIRKLCF